jgi:hypothetical protein
VSSIQTERSVSSFSTAARAGGLVLALGYLSGLVSGPLVAALGGLALNTFGRSLRMGRAGQEFAAAGFTVVAGALGVAAIRWGTLELAELRSVQAVLGPTVLVGPEPAAIAAIIAAVAASVALGLWVAALPVKGFIQWTWTGLETLTMALALVTAFWGPKILFDSPASTSEMLASLGIWAAATAVVTFAGIAGGLGALMLPRPIRLGLMGAALVALAIAAGLIGSTL